MHFHARLPFCLQSSVQLLSRVNLAKQKAQQAVNAGDSAFNDVENILKKLRGEFYMGFKKWQVSDGSSG